MKTSLALGLIVIVVIVGASGWYYYATHHGPVQNSASSCSDPNSISDHIYNPSRLEIVRACVTVAGLVDTVIPERDGDYHIWLNLDAAYHDLNNDPSIHGGDLVVEIICVGSVSQPDAITSCQGYTNHITIPGSGQHITVSGPYVYDTAHDWYEVHPVYSLVVS
ncbi:MAG TPA: hypothetical protein VFE98_03780 [Candidatus Bathyarchaeia archaeon]|nr:hypothetical protein [Candidatus Bathyarchaeia archaeon]